MRTCSRLVLPLVLAATAASAATGLRNPFWPKGYVGEMTPISAEARPKKPKPKPKPKMDPKAAAAKAAQEEAARKEAAAREAAAKEAAAKEAAAKEAAAKEAAAKEAAEKAAREAAAKAEAERKREISREDWIKAKKSLKIGNPAVVTTQDGRTQVDRRDMDCRGVPCRGQRDEAHREAQALRRRLRHGRYAQEPRAPRHGIGGKRRGEARPLSPRRQGFQAEGRRNRSARRRPRDILSHRERDTCHKPGFRRVDEDSGRFAARRGVHGRGRACGPLRPEAR